MTMRPREQQYKVDRPLYSVDSFEEEHEKVYRQRKSLLDHVRQYFTCDARRVKNTALSLLPIIGWIRIYQIKEWLLSDIVSGVSTGLVAVLQGLAYCLLASLPPWYGLFSAFFPVVAYFFLGTSRHISVGPFPVLCLMIGSVVTRLVPDEGPPMNITGFEGLSRDDQRVLVASSASFMVGLMQLGMGLLQVGFVVRYLSDTLVSGFTTAAAVHILVSQLKFVLGLVVPGISGPLALVYTLEKIFVQITSTNICDLVTSLIIMVAVFVVKEINDRYKAKLPVPIPIEVIMTVVACGVSYGFDFKTRFKVDVVGHIPQGYETPMAPDIDIFQETAMEAFPMAIVGFAVAFSVAKVYSVKHDYTIDGNQELIAFGVSNIFGASFKSFAASTALSRSAVQESTGGKTQVAGLLSAIIVMIVTLAIGFLLEPLPRSVLGAVVLVNLKGMLMQVTEVPYLWRRDKPDCVVWLVTCIASIFLGLDLGLAVGLGIELITVVFRAQLYVLCVTLSNNDSVVPRAGINEPEGVKIFRIPSPIFFANIEFFKTKLTEAIGFSPLRILRKRNKALRSIRKLLKNGDMEWTTVSFWFLMSRDNKEDLDLPVNLKDLPIKIDWNRELPANISVPRVELHSLVLDFAAVSFLDISALKGLKTMLKELVRVDVEVYIVACDTYILEKLHACSFFDDEVRPSIFYLTLHDAMLAILEKHPEASEKSSHLEKVSLAVHLHFSHSQTPGPETKF
uniref:Solute carrier family 26 member 3, tandem duplicate 2 n=1 Tax=Gadus morhua TaxID=8049 RepID=A0A8C5AGB7_GADMO